MNFIILGDKYQKGMKSKGCAGLIKIDKNTVLFQHQYDVIKKYYPQATIIYVGGFESKKIENFISKNYSDVVFINNSQHEKLNEGYSLSLVKKLLRDDVFIVTGYSLLQKKMFQDFDTKLGSQIVIVSDSTKNIGCIIDQNKINNISFDLPNYIEDIYYLSKKDCIILQKILCGHKHRNYFIFELINKIIDSGVDIKPFFYKQKIKNKYYEYSK